ncbi:diguanylate cyclase (GGDEF)-like protein [Deinococcus metalli]|uniref:Diguanylate cyclase n=1 Tax=Deinococcus metalli TaxID=1141878 RepID=A0A7W8KD49_9DEIO|nr:CHASE2 domain-containing protein [Deinococcus metalli]MBB5376015.1 diguanylate cyclase (GGDEF)-like protein [Deinococcus metalli]GHF41455.1 diguanylate cyclase [Deinococcus metalli]
MRWSPERSLAAFTVPGAAVLAAALALAAPQNDRLWDSLNRTLPAPADPRVVVVGIDAASLRDYGRIGSWPRDLYSQALRTLNEAGVSAIGVNVLLSDPAVGDDRLRAVFSRPNVVLATAPGDPDLPPRPGWTSPTGVSALNISSDGVVRHFQTAYPAQDAGLVPSFARQVAVAAGRSVPLDDTPRLLRYRSPDPQHLPAMSFRDVVNGNVRYGDLQGKVVILGLTADGLGGPAVRDISGQDVPAVQMQARAVSSLLDAPFVQLHWSVLLLLGVACAVGAVLARGLWGFALAALPLALAVPLWLENVLLPGTTLSLCAIVGTALVMAERWWNLRNLGMRDPLTGFGNRVAFTRAVEQRWQGRQDRPLGLVLVDLSGFRKVNDAYGRAAGDDLLRDLSARIGQHRRRGDLLFRWGPDEFAVLLDNAGPQELASITQRIQASLDELSFRDVPLRASVGAARTGPEIGSPTELVEAASRSRYRVKYQRLQRG